VEEVGKPLVPVVKPIHDRLGVEIARGCTRGCRFCQAGIIYRPVRERSIDEILAAAEKGIASSGYEELALLSLSSGDYTCLPQLMTRLMDRFADQYVSISMPSMRVGTLTPEIMSQIKRVRKTGFTVAPEAGTDRLREVINKGISETDILNAAEQIVAAGIPNIKLYFMVGLPTETMDDIEAIVTLCKKIKHRFLKSSRAKKRMGEITVSLNSFVPKPFTPFQWVKMDDVHLLKEKIKKVKNGLKRVANLRVHADIPRWAYIQALLSRGDRKVAQLLSLVNTNQGNWPKTFKSSPINPDFYVLRERSLDELLPWDFIDHGIRKSFLKTEYKRALQGKTSPPCPMESCNICGVCQEKVKNKK
jgi:radical SAM superfamily enzyme YgiQ (UPF0313 family)